MKSADPVGLGEFKIPLRRLAPISRMTTRSGQSLQYRLYKSWSSNLVILYHGVGGDSRYMAPLALALAEENLANVVTPDFRHHGEGGSGQVSPVQADDLARDFEEMLIHLRQSLPAERLILGGHSLGGGFVAKILSEPGAGLFSEGWLFAPFMGKEVATPDFGGWIIESGSEWKIAMPEIYKRGEEVLTYNENFLKAALPKAEALQSIPNHLKVRVLLGASDQVIDAPKSAAYFQASNIKAAALPDTSHIGVVTSPQALKEIKTWL